jgi:hypothetical protein
MRAPEALTRRPRVEVKIVVTLGEAMVFWVEVHHLVREEVARELAREYS